MQLFVFILLLIAGNIFSVPPIGLHEFHAGAIKDSEFKAEEGEVWMMVTNNNQFCDCKVSILDDQGNVVDSMLVYSEPALLKLQPGTYDVVIEALGSLKGLDNQTVIEDVVITAGKVTSLGFDFKSASLEMFTRIGNEDIDCEIIVKEVSSWTTVATSRTYITGAKLILSPAKYEIKVSPLGEHKDLTPQIIKLQLSQGLEITKLVSF